jgi:transcriptional regulator CtsR
MTPKNKNPESSVTNDIIEKVHRTLADTRTGGAVLEFLKSTEPEFMDEVNRFIRTEIGRMRYSRLSEDLTLYLGSIIGASYIAGFLIAREASHKMFNNIIPMKSDIKQALSQEQVDKIIDKGLDEKKSYSEIAKHIRAAIEGKSLTSKKKANDSKPRGGHLNIGDLD